MPKALKPMEHTTDGKPPAPRHKSSGWHRQLRTFNILSWYLGSFVAALGILWTYTASVPNESRWNLLGRTPDLKFALSAGLGLLISGLVGTIRLAFYIVQARKSGTSDSNPGDPDCPGDPVADSSLDNLQALTEGRGAEDIVALAPDLLRRFQLDTDYPSSRRLLEIVQQAKGLNNAGPIFAAAMIEEGWSYVPDGDCDRAMTVLEQGLDQALKLGDQYLVARAKRHMAGCLIEMGKPEEALLKLDESASEAKKIKTSDKRGAEMLAGVEFGKAVACLALEQLDDAGRHCARAHEQYEKLNDGIRLVKVLSMEGTIAEHSGKYPDARAKYQAGLLLATELHRREDIYWCHAGLSSVCQKLGDEDASKHHLMEASRLKPVTRLVFENAREGRELRP